MSTRKINAILQESCGLKITSCEVIKATKRLDKKLTQWGNQPLKVAVLSTANRKNILSRQQNSVL